MAYFQFVDCQSSTQIKPSVDFHFLRPAIGGRKWRAIVDTHCLSIGWDQYGFGGTTANLCVVPSVGFHTVHPRLVPLFQFSTSVKNVKCEKALSC